jgi:hypothetical protein
MDREIADAEFQAHEAARGTEILIEGRSSIF